MSVIQLGRGRISAWSQIWRLQHDRNAISLRHALLSPPPQHLFNFACDLLACFGAVHTARQQLIVWSVVVANGGAHRQDQSLFVKISTSLRTAYATAAAHNGVFGNGCHFVPRTAWE